MDEPILLVRVPYIEPLIAPSHSAMYALVTRNAGRKVKPESHQCRLESLPGRSSAMPPHHLPAMAAAAGTATGPIAAAGSRPPTVPTPGGGKVKRGTFARNRKAGLRAMKFD